MGRLHRSSDCPQSGRNLRRRWRKSRAHTRLKPNTSLRSCKLLRCWRGLPSEHWSTKIRRLVWPSLLRRRPVVNAQAFVAGREATSAIVCWKGAVLASLHFEVVKKASSRGHATVVRLIENAEMSAAAEEMARRLNLSGLYGFDFMLEAETGNTYLVEINPRSTQVGHLSLGPGRDIPAALYAALSGKAVEATPKITEKDTIALFPQEWIRDAESPFLRLAYHDHSFGRT